MSVQNVSSTPEYIETFLQENSDKLSEIYGQGMRENNNIGCLGLKCSQKENKMDVFFMNAETLYNTLPNEETLMKILDSIQEKRVYFINDLDRNSLFLVYL